MCQYSAHNSLDDTIKCTTGFQYLVLKSKKKETIKLANYGILLVQDASKMSVQNLWVQTICILQLKLLLLNFYLNGI